MTARFSRLWAMAVKELLVVLLDRQARIMLLVAPVLQLTLFGFASTLEVKAVDLGYVNRDAGIAAERVLASLGGSPNVRRLVRYEDNAALLRGIERREVLAGLVLPQDLSRRVAVGGTGDIGLLLDGRRTNSAQIVAGYVTDIIQTTGHDLRPQARMLGPEVLASHWFNPNLEYLWFTMPGLIALIVTMMVFTVSLLSVSREREMGSFDELMVLPLTSAEVLIGKTLPGFLVGLFNAGLYSLLIPLVYGVPLAGSISLLLLASTAYALAVTGIGLSVSCISQNQQQSFLIGFLVMVPLILLSGYASPVDNMPGWLQVLAQANPVMHMLVICEGIFLKDMEARSVLAHTWPMLVAAALTLVVAARLFRLRTT